MPDSLEATLSARIPGARLERHRIAGVHLQLLQSDFPRGPLDPQVAASVWEQPPYWAFAWPGGVYLCEWLPAQRPTGKIVDLGCGSGILSIALSLAGCQVVAVDSDPEARWACRANARLNQVEFPILEDLDSAGECDLLVLADFLYDPANLAGLEELCRRSRRVLLADSRLRQCPPAFTPLPPAQRRIVPDLDWGNEFDHVYLAHWQRP